MRLKAKRKTVFKWSEDGIEVNIGNGEGIEFNLDDFEVVDGFNPQYCSFGLDKVELEKPDTPKPIEKLDTNLQYTSIALIDIEDKINQLINAINRRGE